MAVSGLAAGVSRVLWWLKYEKQRGVVVGAPSGMSSLSVGQTGTDVVGSHDSSFQSDTAVKL